MDDSIYRRPDHPRNRVVVKVLTAFEENGGYKRKPGAMYLTDPERAAQLFAAGFVDIVSRF